MALVEYTISEMFDRTVQRFGQKSAIIYQEDTYSWHELHTLVDIMSDRLEAKGVSEGDRVGLWSENSAAWVVTFLALQKLGAVPALLNSNYQKRELVQVMRIGAIRWLCVGNTPSMTKDAALAAAGATHPEGGAGYVIDIREETLQLRKLLETMPDYQRQKPDAVSDCRKLACLLYTTGTTSAPKCVQHSHFSIVNNAIATAEFAEMNSDDRICMASPLFHIFPLCAGLLSSVYFGATICLLSKFGSKDILCCVHSHRCTVLNGVPMNFLRLISSPYFKEYETDSIRVSSIGGDSITETQFELIRKAFPNTTIMRNYGLTEGTCLCSTNLTDQPNLVARCVGRPYPNLKIAIQDPKEKRFLPRGEKGEIVTSGYNVMQGYFYPECEENPAQPIDEDGWLHTGDLGVMDEDGCISIVGRIKDIIIRGGENITPAEIKKEILRYEPVLDALIIGVPHPFLGQEVVACLVLDSPMDYSEEELRCILEVRLAKFKIPAFFLIYDAFPLNPNGKIDMQTLRKDVIDKVAELHEKDERYHIHLQQK